MRTMESIKPARAALVVLVLVIAACGDGSTPIGEQPHATTSTVVDSGSTRGSSTSAVAPQDDRPVAPDFTLSLESGGEFVLSEAGKPVYLVFWAEW